LSAVHFISYEFHAADAVHSAIAEHLFHGEDNQPRHGSLPFGVNE
jgi:hypothetical protein